MNEEQYKTLVAQVGKEAADKIKSEMDAYETKMKQLIEGKASAEDFTTFKSAIEASQQEIKTILEKQGTTMQEVLAKLNPGEFGGTSIAEQLKKDADELAEVFKSKNRQKEYILTVDTKGNPVMKPFDSTKAAGPHATVADIGAPGNVASIAQQIDPTAILRMGNDATIISAFRNTPWVFGLANLVNVGFQNPFFVWFEELEKAGSSAEVPEGGTKPLVQYKYELRSSQYRKEAMLVSFTEEFSLDFERLQSDILRVARIDLINRINSAILPRIKAAATAYNQGDVYAPAGDKVQSPNDWDVIAALAAQVETATFAPMANGVVVNTNKKYRLGTQKDAQNRWLDIPSVLSNLAITANPEMAAQDVLVGDFKQYNIALRGGIIIRVGYNGTDFAENKFSTVVEQFYFDYISEIRKKAIVKGPDFQTVKEAIGA